MITDELVERVRARLIRVPAPRSELDDCLLWPGARRRKGYGNIKYRGRNYSPHVVMFVGTHGPVPEGLILLHACDTPPCCHPGHLRPGTVAENLQEAVERGLMSRDSLGRVVPGPAKLRPTLF